MEAYELWHKLQKDLVSTDLRDTLKLILPICAEGNFLIHLERSHEFDLRIKFVDVLTRCVWQNLGTSLQHEIASRIEWALKQTLIANLRNNMDYEIENTVQHMLATFLSQFTVRNILHRQLFQQFTPSRRVE
jgi:hypothetical protein